MENDTETVTNTVSSPIQCTYRCLGASSGGRISKLNVIQIVPWEANSSNGNGLDGLDTIDMMLIHIGDISEFDVRQAKFAVGGQLVLARVLFQL